VTEPADAVAEVPERRPAAPLRAPLAPPALLGVAHGDGARGGVEEGRHAGEEPPGERDDVTTVLVVDDNPDLRRYVRRHLIEGGASGRGYRVVEAADGEGALAAVRARLPDLVVSDVMMPQLDGVRLLEALRADPETDFLPVILLTARAEAEDRLAGLGLGADDYVTKPFDARELVARVDNLIAQRRRLRERFASGGALPADRRADGAEPVAEKGAFDGPPPVETADAAALSRTTRRAIASTRAMSSRVRNGFVT
jgi:DNA-binding response OmpR family regulator